MPRRSRRFPGKSQTFGCGWHRRLTLGCVACSDTLATLLKNRRNRGLTRCLNRDLVCARPDAPESVLSSNRNFSTCGTAKFHTLWEFLRIPQDRRCFKFNRFKEFEWSCFCTFILQETGASRPSQIGKRAHLFCDLRETPCATNSLCSTAITRCRYLLA